MANSGFIAAGAIVASLGGPVARQEPGAGPVLVAAGAVLALVGFCLPSKPSAKTTSDPSEPAPPSN